MAMTRFGAGILLNAKDNATPVFKRVGAAFAAMGKQFGKSKQFFAGSVAQLSQLRQKMDIGAGLIAASGAAAVFGGSVVQSLKAAASQATAFNAAVGEVATIADPLEFSTERIKSLGDELAVTYGKDSKEQIKALYQAISAGASDYKTASDVMHTANQLAIGGVTDTETAIDGLTSILNAYTKESLTATNVADAMFVAVRAGKTTIGELSQQIGRAGASANMMGVSMQETLAAIAATTKQGINTQQAVSGLAAAFANVAKPTVEARKEAKKLGIEFTADALRAKGFAKFLNQIVTSSGYTENSMTNLFGSIEAVRSMSALAANEGAEFNAVMQQMASSAGATESAFGRMEQEFNVTLGQIDQIGQSIKKSFGQSVITLVSPLANAFKAVANGFRDIVKALPPGVRDAITGVIGSFGGLIAGTGGMIAVVAGLRMFGVTLTGIIAGLGSFVALLSVGTILFGGFGIAAYAAYRAYQKNIGGMAEATASLWSQVKLGFRGMLDIISSGKLSDAVMDEVNKTKNGGAAKFLAFFSRFVERLKVFWDGLKEGFETGLNALQPAIERLKQHFGGFFDLFSTDNTADVLAKWSEMGEKAGAKLASLGEIAIDLAIKLSDWASEAIQSMEGLTAGDIMNGIQDLVETFKSLLSVLKGVGTVFKALYTAGQFIGKLFNIIGNVIGETLGSIWYRITKTLDILDELGKYNFSGARQIYDQMQQHFDQPWEKRNQGSVEAQADMQEFIGNPEAARGMRNAGDIKLATQRFKDAKEAGDMEAMKKAYVEIARLTGVLEKMASRPLTAEIAITELRRGNSKVREAESSRSLNDMPLAI